MYNGELNSGRKDVRFVEEKQEVEEVCEGKLASEVCEEAQGYWIEGDRDALRKEEREKGDTMEEGEGDHHDEKRNRDDECSRKGGDRECSERG